MTTAKTESGIEFDLEALDAIERRFWRGSWESVPETVARERGIELASFGPVQASAVRALARHPVLNLVLGAAEPGAVVGGHLATALDWVREQGVAARVPLTPGLPTAADAEELLAERGLTPLESWTRYVRDAHLPRFSPPGEVEVVEITDADEEPFGSILAAGFELPAWAASLFATLPGRPGFRCYVARLDGAAQATGAMFIDGRLARLGLTATLDGARGRGCQPALLHRRIIDAGDAGARLLSAETGGDLHGGVDASARNLLRAGFERAHLCPIWGEGSAENA